MIDPHATMTHEVCMVYVNLYSPPVLRLSLPVQLNSVCVFFLFVFFEKIVGAGSTRLGWILRFFIRECLHFHARKRFRFFFGILSFFEKILHVYSTPDVCQYFKKISLVFDEIDCSF